MTEVQDVEIHIKNLEETVRLSEEATKNARIELNQFNNLQKEKYEEFQRDLGLTRFKFDDRGEFWSEMDLTTTEGKILYINKVASTWIPGYEGTGYDWILYLIQPLKEGIYDEHPEAEGKVPEYIKVDKAGNDWGVMKLQWIKGDKEHGITSHYGTGTPSTAMTVGYGTDSCDEHNDRYDMGTITTIKPATFEEAVERAYGNAQRYVKQYDIDLTK